MYFVRTFRSASSNTCRFKAPLILASTAFRVCSLYNNTIILRDERWILEQLRLMVAAFSVPGRIEEEFPIAKRRRRRKRLSRKKNWRISVVVCGRFSQCFFPGDLETGGGWFHRGVFRFTYFSSFSEALVLISCEVHNKQVLIVYWNYTNSLPSTLLSESFSANPIASFFFPSWPLLSEADLGKKVEVLGVLMEAGKSVMGIGKCLTPARLPDRCN